MSSEPYPVHGAGLGLRRSFLGALAERHPFVCHGLSLSIGAPTPLDLHFVRQVKAFLDDHGIRAYTEHLIHRPVDQVDEPPLGSGNSNSSTWYSA